MNFLKFFRWIKGYVIVESDDNNAAAFINFLLRKKISVWDVKKSNKCVVFCMYAKNYRDIIQLRREFNLDIKLQHTGFFGIPRKLIAVKSRKSIVIGPICFFAILIFMSSFIWNIEINGSEKIEKNIIVDAYTELGVKIGMPKYKFDSYSLKERLPLLIREVSWCSFNLEGTLLTVNITEVNETDKSEKKVYSNITAKIDGIIKRIDIISGNKCVKIGDVVSKGELLVSGAPELNSQNFTFSKGEILAETNREFTVKIPREREYSFRTGKTNIRSLISVFGFKLPLYLDGIHYESVSKSNDKQIAVNGVSLPITIRSKTFYEIISLSETISATEALNEAKSSFVSTLKNIDVRSLEIIDIIQSEESDCYKFIFICKCLENISQTNKINVS